jgi:hypothetical protein
MMMDTASGQATMCLKWFSLWTRLELDVRLCNEIRLKA